MICRSRLIGVRRDYRMSDRPESDPTINGVQACPLCSGLGYYTVNNFSIQCANCAGFKVRPMSLPWEPHVYSRVCKFELQDVPPEMQEQVLDALLPQEGLQAKPSTSREAPSVIALPSEVEAARSLMNSPINLPDPERIVTDPPEETGRPLQRRGRALVPLALDDPLRKEHPDMTEAELFRLKISEGKIARRNWSQSCKVVVEMADPHTLMQVPFNDRIYQWYSDGTLPSEVDPGLFPNPRTAVWAVNAEKAFINAHLTAFENSQDGKDPASADRLVYHKSVNYLISPDGPSREERVRLLNWILAAVVKHLGRKRWPLVVRLGHE